MANSFDNNADETIPKVGKILNRVDQLPVLDNRSADEIVGYDENGIPDSATPPKSAAPAQSATDSAQDRDMEDWRKTFGHKIPAAVKEFLEYRHREWELEIEADLQPRQGAPGEQTRKP